MIVLYGSPRSSSGRTRWMLEELGVPYEYTKLDTRAGQTRSTEYLSVYGGGKIPALRDGEVTLGESVAINFYLAEKYAPELMPSDLVERAQVYQWSLWSITNLQPELLTVMFDAMAPPEARRPAVVEAAREQIGGMLAYLESNLADREYLVGNRFTVADVNTGSIVSIARAVGLLGHGYPHVAAWMERLASRPAFVRAMKD